MKRVYPVSKGILVQMRLFIHVFRILFTIMHSNTYLEKGHYFYPTGSYSHCMYTGIGRRGHQDSPDENKHLYHLNIEVLSHRTNKKHLLVFEKKDKAMYFVGEYRLTEMHQNVQPDENGMLRRVFVFQLTQVSDYFEW